MRYLTLAVFMVFSVFPVFGQASKKADPNVLTHEEALELQNAHKDVQIAKDAQSMFPFQVQQFGQKLDADEKSAEVRLKATQDNIATAHGFDPKKVKESDDGKGLVQIPDPPKEPKSADSPPKKPEEKK